jgi:hypothetical protein
MWFLVFQHHNSNGDDARIGKQVDQVGVKELAEILRVLFDELFLN